MPSANKANGERWKRQLTVLYSQSMPMTRDDKDHDGPELVGERGQQAQ
jgi:hypothetical protein